MRFSTTASSGRSVKLEVYLELLKLASHLGQHHMPCDDQWSLWIELSHIVYLYRTVQWLQAHRAG